MATRSNANRSGGPRQTSSEGRKEASGGSGKTAATSGVSGSGRSSAADTSRGGGSTRSTASKDGTKAPKKSSVPSQKGK